jgi:beta-ureidopropionase
LHLPDAESKAQEHDLELVSCRFDSAPEQLRPPKIVRVGILQHKLPLPPGVPIKEQRDALYKLAKGAIETAAIGGVNVFCFQEAWSESTLLQNFFV